MKTETDTIQDYLNGTLENAQDHAANPPQLMYMIHRMDDIFQKEIFSRGLDMNAAANLLAMNSYIMLLGAIRQALSGHIVPVFPIVRAALESACYVYLIALDDKKGDIWLDRHKSNSATERCRKAFKVSDVVRGLKSVSPAMSEFVDDLYDACIDFGAHPNCKSIMEHLTNLRSEDGKLSGWELTSVYGHNSWEVNFALLVCVETGQAIAFLLSASSEKHPLTHDRIYVFQEWMNEKDRMIEEINGESHDYTGPLFCSVKPPI